VVVRKHNNYYTLGLLESHMRPRHYLIECW